MPYERRQDSQPQALGYKVRSKIYGCDIVSIGPGEPPLVVITELNLTLSPELICKASSGVRIRKLPITISGQIVS
ncbi:hypothetical protein ACFQY5_37320 [Paeniroseomonas aquatica]|uniref:hypothetical protein n=1 Tax=Paeniroseomonas aquatica TaxID=373043 RepID=UPI0036087B3F